MIEYPRNEKLGRLVRPSCPVCKASPSGIRKTSADGGTWDVCPSCGLMWEADVLDGWPNARYRRHGGELPAGVEYDPTESKIARHMGGQSAWEWVGRLDLAETLTRPEDRGNLLEIGFGGGEILDLAKTRGWKRVAGIEVCSDFVLYAKSRGVEAYYADVSEAPLACPACFDLVVANEVMEHVEWPVSFLTGAAKYLNTTGKLWASFALDRQTLHDGEWHYWRESAVREAARQAQLELVQYEEHGDTGFAWLRGR